MAADARGSGCGPPWWDGDSSPEQVQGGPRGGRVGRSVQCRRNRKGAYDGHLASSGGLNGGGTSGPGLLAIAPELSVRRVPRISGRRALIVERFKLCDCRKA